MVPRKVLCLPALLVAGLVVSAAFAQPGNIDGWDDLLINNDHSERFDTTGNWASSEEKTVTLTPRPGESGWQRYDAYLWSKEKFRDFEIQFEYKVAKGGNSGFYFRVGDRKSPVAKGIEVQIYDSHPKGADGKLNDHDSGGIIPGVPPKKNASKPASEWNQFHITSQDNKLTVKLNGEVVNELDLTKAPFASRPAEGHIGFQDHGLPLSLRNIKIREL
ncbi:MAG: DUF1080 domain-containing protein [Planctomycetales bacterium]